MDLITLDDVRAAATDIAEVVVRTPLLPARCAPQLLLKPESLQPVGSFKLRGATHAVARLTAEQRARGVVTHSSGNHGQALAYAARAAAAPCTVVIPEGAPTVKIDQVRALGADVVLVPATQRLDAADARASLAAGEVVVWTPERTGRTSADGLRTHLSALTFAHLRDRLDGIVTVTEEEITAAMGRLVKEARLVVEPSGAVAVAAHLFRGADLPAGRIVAVVTGGNVDPAVLAAALTGDGPPAAH